MIRRLRDPYEVFQLDATAYPGNSGSPLYDMATGGVVGVLNKVFVQTTKERVLQDPSGISYAIPARHGRARLRGIGGAGCPAVSAAGAPPWPGPVGGRPARRLQTSNGSGAGRVGDRVRARRHTRPRYRRATRTANAAQPGQQPMSTLTAKLTTGVVWMVLFRGSVRFIGVISTIILARLLTPEDFGLVAMATAVLAAVAVLMPSRSTCCWPARPPPCWCWCHGRWPTSTATTACATSCSASPSAPSSRAARTSASCTSARTSSSRRSSGSTSPSASSSSWWWCPRPGTSAATGR